MFKKQKIIFSLIISLIIFQVKINSIFASPPAPAPRCQIEGIIQEATHQDAWSNDNTSGPTDQATSQSERYELKVSIIKYSYIDGDQSYQSCSSLYSSSSIQNIVLTTDKITNNKIPQKGQRILGVVRSFWWKQFDSYELVAVDNKPLSIFDWIKLFLISIRQLLKV